MGKGKLKQALELAGSEHRYQKILVGLLMCAWVSMVFVFLSSPFIYMDPLFNCASKGDHIVHEKEACRKIDECSIVDDFTLVADAELYCGKSWARVTIQSIFPLGSFIGLLVMNVISDTRGRRQAFLGSLGISIFAVLLTLYGGTSGDIFYLIIAQFLGGFASYSIMPLAYTLLADFLSDKFRPRAVVMLNSSGGIATISLGLFYLTGLNWFYFVLFFQLVPFIALFIAFYVFLQESPYILMNHNEVQHAEEVFYRIAQWNGFEKNDAQIKRIIELEEQRDHTRQPSFKNVLRTLSDWRFLKMIILLTAINAIANLNYFGISYSFAQEGLGYGYNSIVMGGVQFCSVLFLTWTASNVPRKIGIAGFYFLAMVVELLYFTDFVANNLFVSTTLIGVARICALNGYCLVACCETQAFQVSIQSTAAGLIEGLGIIGGIVAPFIIELAEKVEADPIAICALFVSCAIWPAYFMRETFHTPPVVIPSFMSLDEPLNPKTYEKQMEEITTTENSKDKIELRFQRPKTQN